MHTAHRRQGPSLGMDASFISTLIFSCPLELLPVQVIPLVASVTVNADSKLRPKTESRWVFQLT